MDWPRPGAVEALFAYSSVKANEGPEWLRAWIGPGRALWKFFLHTFSFKKKYGGFHF